MKKRPASETAVMPERFTDLAARYLRHGNTMSGNTESLKIWIATA
jgi:hypothetical protein